VRNHLSRIVVALGLLTAACAGVPTSSAIHVGRAVPARGGLDDLDVRVFPPAWHSGLPPVEVASGFLHSLVNNDDDYAIARSYLTTTAAAKWRPDVSVTTYDDTSLQLSGSAVHVVVTAPRLGRIDAHGDYESSPGTLRETFTMARVGGSWKIDKLPDGTMLSGSDAERAFRLADVFYLNQKGTTLVPDQVLLRLTQRGVATTLVTTLLAGPSHWLAPAVHTALPPGVGLIGNVPVHTDGTAEVNFTASIRSASPQLLAALSAQLVWTLRQISGVTGVRLLADGAPLSVGGEPATQPVSAWPTFDPSAAPSVGGLLYVRGGHLGATGADAAAILKDSPDHLVAVGRSRDGDTIAAVQQTGAGQRLLVSQAHHRFTARLSANAMTAPTFDVDGNIITVVADAHGRHLVSVGSDGRVHRLAADSTLLSPALTSLRISREGARVAAVVGGQLLVGRVSGRGGGLAFGDLRAIAPSLQGVRGVSWVNSDTVVVTCSGGPGAQRRVVETDTDGYGLQPISLVVRGQPVDVAAAPQQPLAIATDDDALWQDIGGWHRFADGSGLVYSG